MCKAGIGTPYWYEWEIGLLKCLEMLYDENIRSVVFQDPRFSSIDDVVINYNDGSTLNIQVKHTDVDNNFTFSTLLSGDNPMLVKWAKDWEKNKANINIKSINILTNKKFGTNVTDGLCSFKNFLEIVLPQWQKDVNYSSKMSDENAAIDIIKMKLNFLGDDVFNFIKLLKFEGSDGRKELGRKFKDYIAQILGTENDNIVNQVAKNLYANLRIWTTSLREKTEVEREDIYSALCSEQSYIPQFELLYPERPIFPSRDRLRGLPGSGKTNFISYLSKTEQSIVDFYFYTYLPAKKGEMFFSDDAGYYSGNHLWKCLLHQLKEKFKDEG